MTTATSNARSPRAGPRKILVVDDSLVMQALARIALERSGWAVTAAHSGAEGVATASTLQPDAIVLDVEMPGMDGPTTLAALRDGPATKDLPVIFLTGHADPAVMRRLEALGPAAVLCKPFDVAALALQIDAALEPSA